MVQWDHKIRESGGEESLIGDAHKTPLALMMDEGVEPRDEDTSRSSVTGMPEAHSSRVTLRSPDHGAYHLGQVMPHTLRQSEVGPSPQSTFRCWETGSGTEDMLV